MKQPDELLALFADYNPAIWPLQAVAYVAAVVALVLIATRPSRTTDRLVVGFLAALWLFIGVVFQGIYVRDIDATPAAVGRGVYEDVALLAVGVLATAVLVWRDRGPQLEGHRLLLAMQGK
jgi:hypothetical protein